MVDTEMTKLYLLEYECRRCKRIFLSYFEPIDDIDKQILAQYYASIESGVLFGHLMKGRDCRKCRKGVDLLSYEPST